MPVLPLFDETFLRAQWRHIFRDATIANRETALNTIIYRLYRLTPEEIATVEAG